jgi:histone H3/H4
MSNEISSLSLKRLFNRAGIKRVKHDSYNNLIKYISNFSKQILSDTNTLISNRKNKTITEEDLKNGLIVNNLLKIIDNIHNGGDNEGFCHGSPSQCGIVNQIIPVNSPEMQKGGAVDRIIPNTFCNGNVSQCFYTDLISECKVGGGGIINNSEYIFSIPNTQFQRFLNTLQFKDIKMTKSSVNYLQYIIEQDAIKYLLDKKKDMEGMNQKQFDLMEESNDNSFNS